MFGVTLVRIIYMEDNNGCTILSSAFMRDVSLAHVPTKGMLLKGFKEPFLIEKVVQYVSSTKLLAYDYTQISRYTPNLYFEECKKLTREGWMPDDTLLK